jgi:hypothetical protein
MKEQTSSATLRGHCLTTSNGDQGTLRGSELSTLITPTSRGIRRCLLIGSSVYFKETSINHPYMFLLIIIVVYAVKLLVMFSAIVTIWLSQAYQEP